MIKGHMLLMSELEENHMTIMKTSWFVVPAPWSSFFYRIEIYSRLRSYLNDSSAFRPSKQLMPI
jgi:hypothetical protein